ncbi:cytochrome P450 family protein [Cavenderia fasciculata]|uniref:Cytochrome P450 family protein n=1 Tax=Cavenderia fasciculata TaxID=261658 RepID=F4Q9I1_CACFS|nr:cytochrome P450 family protein [Cavenderia fasciculata]EGG15350.1 cytochrome P450 family protein [Cavenderia fasciculata]|eukprot:XP_004354092.1 cytochrome P450 family protein [Cavenderia fasciculata]
MVKLTKNRPICTPPGPIPFPVIGNLHLLSKGEPHIGLFQLYLQYGKIYQFWFGTVNTIVLNEPDVIKEAFVQQSAIFTDHYIHPTMHIVGDSNNLGFTNGHEWINKRAIITKALQKSGFFHPENLFTREFMEMKKVLDQAIQTSNNNILNIRPFIKKLTFNIITKFLFSNATSYDNEGDEIMFNLMDAFETIASQLGNGNNTGDLIPILKPFNSPNELQRATHLVLTFVKPFVNEHLLSLDPENPRDFLDNLLLELQDESKSMMMSLDSIERIFIELLVGGVDTISTTIEFLVIHLSNNPEVQEKLHKELIQTPEIPYHIDNKAAYPYLNAVIKEGWRYRPTVPLGLPHRNNKSTMINSYYIPQNCQIIANYYAANLSPQLWNEPNKFDPMRFINNPSLDLSVFGYGPRKFIGVLMIPETFSIRIDQRNK